jgi:hypothetical protein
MKSKYPALGGGLAYWLKKISFWAFSEMRWLPQI